jgi:integrase
MASITQRDGRWRVRITRKGHQPVTKTFDLKRDAEAFAATVEADIARGIYRAQDSKATFRELVERYRTEVTTLKRGASQEGYLLGAILAAESVARPLLDRFVAEISPAIVATWRDARLKQVKPATLAREWATLAHVLAHGEREWSVPLPQGNPFRQVRKPQVLNQRDRRVSDDEINAICSATGSLHLEAIVRLAVETGARRSELLAFRWAAIDLKRRTAKLAAGTTKNGHGRALPLSTRAIAVLETMGRRLDGKVFDLRPDSVTQAFSRAVERAKKTYTGEDAGFLVGLSFHALRHECLSRLAERGWSATEIAALSGHRTLQLVQRYVHHRPEDLALKLA